MPRIKLLTTREGLSAEQQEVFDAIIASRGGIRGPFGIVLRAAPIAAAVESLGGYLRFGSKLDATLREVVMSGAARLLDCDFEWALHSAAAVELGVDRATMSAIEAKRFAGIAGDLGLALRLTEAILDAHRVPADLFDAARTRWGDDLLVEITSLVGYFAFISAVMNTFEVEAPAKSAG